MMNKKKHKDFEIDLSEEEKDLLDSIERGEWKTVDHLEKEIAKAKAAANYFKFLNGYSFSPKHEIIPRK